MTTTHSKNFTPQALAAIEVAKAHALKLERRITGAEDLFFGAMYHTPSEYESNVAIVLREVFGVTRERVHLTVEAISMRPIVNYETDEEFTLGAKKALKIAAKRGMNGVANRFDLMVGVAQCKDVILLRVLKDLEIDPLRLALVMSNSLAWTKSASKN